MELFLKFEDNNTGHDDLVLRFARKERRCDTYYLTLDQGILPEREDAEKICLVLIGCDALQ